MPHSRHQDKSEEVFRYSKIYTKSSKLNYQLTKQLSNFATMRNLFKTSNFSASSEHLFYKWRISHVWKAAQYSNSKAQLIKPNKRKNLNMNVKEHIHYPLKKQ